MTYTNEFPNNSLGQSTMNKKAKKIFDQPDTDCRLIKYINGATSIYPNLMHDHTKIEYVAPTANLLEVNFYAPINTEDRTLHYLTLDNSNNTGSKTFVFSNDYVFLDDLGVNEYTLIAGQKLVWYGTYTNGKLRFRVSSESTS
jgi:hypothetical protein